MRDLDKPPQPGKVFIDIVSGREGPSVCIGDHQGSYRLAGPKPWGGGTTQHRFSVDIAELRERLDQCEGSPKPIASEPTALARLIKAANAMVDAKSGSFNEVQACAELCAALKGIDTPQPAGLAADDALREFASWAISKSLLIGCDLDGGSVQDKARDLGLLDEVQIAEPCGESCACADAGVGFPTTCYRFSAVLAKATAEPGEG